MIPIAEMSEETEIAAWLETASGDRLPLDNSVSIGRSVSQNRHAIAHDKLSRRHALIHAQEGGEFWILDLGSTNGTYVDGDRVVVPVRLMDGAKIDLARAVVLTFRQPCSPEQLRDGTMMEQTIVDAHEEIRWLLIADIEGFSELSKRLPPAQLAAAVGEWLGACREVITRHGGRINKYMGDGFLAFWRDDHSAAMNAAAAMRDFYQLRTRGKVAFRIVLHRGLVAVGGAPSLGEESLLSDDLSFAFRLEKLAGSLHTSFLFSSNVSSLLATALPLKQVPGLHELKGFPPVDGLTTLAES